MAALNSVDPVLNPVKVTLKSPLLFRVVCSCSSKTPLTVYTLRKTFLYVGYPDECPDISNVVVPAVAFTERTCVVKEISLPVPAPGAATTAPAATNIIAAIPIPIFSFVFIRSRI